MAVAIGTLTLKSPKRITNKLELALKIGTLKSPERISSMGVAWRLIEEFEKNYYYESWMSTKLNYERRESQLT